MLGILIIQVVEDLVVCLQAQVERCPVLLVRGQPSYLRHCQHTRQEAVFHLVNVVAGLRPHVALHAESKFLLAAQGAQGIEAIYLVHGVHAPATVIWFVHEEVALLSLHEVDIQVLVGHDDGLQATVGRLGAETHAVPCHDDRLGLVVVVPVGQKFVPHDNVLAVPFLEENAQLLHEPRLQLVNAVKSQFLHTVQTHLVGFPLLRGALVATDMDVVVGEDGCHMAEDTLEEVDDTVIAHVENIMGDATVYAHLILLAGVATELGIRSHGSHHVAGEVHFGDYLYVACLGVGNNLAQVLEGVEHATAVLGVIKEFLSVAIVGKRTLAYGTHFGEFGILGDVYAPTLVVGQMPVEAVHLVKGHDVQHLLHLFLVEEVAGNVEHVATMSQVRTVLYVQTGNGPCPGTALLIPGKKIAWHELLQRLQGIEPTAELRSLDGDALRCDAHGVGLLGKRLVGTKPYLTQRGSIACLLDFKAYASGYSQLSGKCLCMLLHPSTRVGNGRKRSEWKFAILYIQLVRIWDESRSAHLLQIFRKTLGIHKFHGVVLVTLVPKTYATVFRRTAPQIHGYGSVCLGLDFVRARISGCRGSVNDKLIHTRSRRIGPNHLVLFSRGYPEDIAKFVGKHITIGL